MRRLGLPVTAAAVWKIKDNVRVLNWSQRHFTPSPSVAPEPPKAAPAPPEPPKAAPAPPEPPKTAPAPPEPPKAAPAPPEPPKAAPAPPEPPKAAPVAPEPPKAAPVAPEPPKAAPAPPEPPKTAPAPPEPPKAAPVAPEPPKAAPAPPEPPKTAPAPPEPPKAAPAPPEPPKAAPVAPEPPRAAPVAPEPPKAAPAPPEPPKTAPAPPEPPKAAPVAPEPPKAAPAPPEPPKTAPAPPEPPKAAPAPPEPPKAAPVAPEPPRAAPVAPEPPKAAPAPPEPPKTAPAPPEPPKTAPAPPEPPKAAPAPPEPPKAAPVAPEPPRAAPVAPEPPKAAPAPPEPPKTAPAPPEPPKAAPVAPEPPKAAPAPPEPPKTAPAPPEPPKAAPAPPEPPKTAPAPPEPPKAAPVAPEPPKAAPAPPEPPKTAPAPPEPPKAAPAPPEPPKAAPVAPEPPKAPPSPEPPRSASNYFAVKSEHRFVEASRMRGYHGRGGESEGRREKTYSNLSRRSGKPNATPVGSTDKRLSLSDVVENVEDIKVVFAQRAEAASSRRVSSPPPPPVSSPPPPPPPPLAPPPPQFSSNISSVPTASVGLAGGKLPEVNVNPAVDPTLSTVEDEVFFTIAPSNTVESGQQGVWANSFGFSVDEEIEKARVLRPLVRSPGVLRNEGAKLQLNLAGFGDEGAANIVVDKESLRPLPQKEAVGIEHHEIPDVISEQRDVLQSVSEKQSTSTEGNSSSSVSTSVLETKEASLSPPSGGTASSAFDSTTAAVPVEWSPLAPWTTIATSTDEKDIPCAKVSFDNEGSPVVTILLEEQPIHILSLVQFLHQTITAIENQYATDGTKIDVLLKALPSLSFFNAKHGPLELTCAKRVELLRAKNRLFARMEEASKRLRFVAIVCGGVIKDFGAELFLACHQRVLVDPAQATFGFPSIRFGDFPAAFTVRRLSYYFGSQRAIEMVPKFHEYNAESLEDVGLVESTTPPRAPTFLLWLERKLLALLFRSTQKEMMLRKLIFARGFDTSEVMVGPNPLLRTWARYSMAAIVEENDASKENNRDGTIRLQEGECVNIFSEMVYTTSAVNAASVHALGQLMQRRVLPAMSSRRFVTFRGEEMRYWPDKVKALSSAKDDCAVVLLDCSRRCIESTVKMVNDNYDKLKDVNVVLIGEEHIARPITLKFSNSVVISCASPFRASMFGGLQEVRVFAHDGWPEERCETILTAALTYLQMQSAPYVVCRGSCSKRLIAALATEACRLTLQCDVSFIERAATDVLGLLVGPFHLIDYFGAGAVLRMLEETGEMNTQVNPLLVDWLPAVGRHTLQCMSVDGFLGVNSRRGGFYKYNGDGTAAGLNMEVQSHYLRRRLTDKEVADRLLAVVVNECCELILQGRVRNASDANALTIAAIGFCETTGGALTVADAFGIGALVQKMEELSEWHGPHLRPSSLLKCMAHSRVSFASLSDATIQSARM